MNENTKTNGLWDGAEIIACYTRAQALEDGVLVDLTGWAQEAGFRIPVAVTAGVWALLKPSPELELEGEDEVGRAWDMFSALLAAIRGTAAGDRVCFSPRLTLKVGEKPQPVELWAQCGPGDHGEPVITVMLRRED